MTDFDPAGLLRTLNSHTVRYVVISGIAAQFLGSPMLTADLDICYDRDDENLVRLAAALVELDARLRGVEDDVPFILDAQSLKRGDSFTFSTSLGALDCLGTPAGSSGYPELAADSEVFEIAGTECPVVSLEALIEMKRAAGRPKARIALENLAALQDEIET